MSDPKAQKRNPSGQRILFLAWATLPLFVCAYQVASKWIAVSVAARPSGHWLTALVSNPILLILIACEAGSFVAWMYVLTRMQLSEAFPLSALSYVFVLLASWTVFHEPVSVVQLTGSAAIIAGAWLIGRGTVRS